MRGYNTTDLGLRVEVASLPVTGRGELSNGNECAHLTPCVW